MLKLVSIYLDLFILNHFKFDYTNTILSFFTSQISMTGSSILNRKIEKHKYVNSSNLNFPFKN